jgi:alpha-1,2-rhamnosyltransferase
LVFFYKNALGLINPSLSEGFGLPLIEAAYFNLPILASTIPVFEELMGDNYLKFNQNNIKDMTLKINQFLKQSPKFNYQNIIQNYSFVQMTNQTLALYNKLLE